MNCLKKLLKIFCFTLGTCTVLSCGNETPPVTSIDSSVTACDSKQAAIEVGDGFLRIYCGCTGSGESPGSVFMTPAVLTCTLPTSDSVVFFYFNPSRLRHQILPTGGSSFIPSPVFNPEDQTSQVHSTGFSSASTTYQFFDAFSGLTGQIIVP